MENQERSGQEYLGKITPSLNTDYEKILYKGGGTTLGQEGYEMTFNDTEVTTYNSLITEYIVRYAERKTPAEGKLQALEDHLNQLELDHHQPPPQMV